MGIRLDGNKLRAAIAERGLTSRQVARAAGITDATLSRILAGASTSPVTAARIARVLETFPVSLRDYIAEVETR